jgi:hypothetical protein
MATTIAAGFNQLKSNLEITNLQAGTVSTRQSEVRKAVENELQTLNSFVAGSYVRNTMIAPLASADVDVFMVLAAKYFSPTGYASLLDRLRAALLKRYPTTPRISRNGQAVTIIFTDFRVDVVPAFNRKGGGYLIPDSVGQRWISTDPTVHITKWAEANKWHEGNLVPLLKMLKAWNRSHSELLNSFHLEALAKQVLTNVRISDYPSGARYVFDKARALVNIALADPAGYDGDIGRYLNTTDKRAAVAQRLQRAYDQSVEAEGFAGRGNIRAAFEKWQTVFGDCFPAYG